MNAPHRQPLLATCQILYGIRGLVLRAVDARGTIGAAARPPADFLHNI
jgi:hypothetical protein